MNANDETTDEEQNEVIQNAPEIIQNIEREGRKTERAAYGLAQRLGSRINGDEESQFYAGYENVNVSTEGHHTIRVSMYGERDNHSPPSEIHELTDATEYRIGSFCAMNGHEFKDNQGNEHSSCLVIELERDDELTEDGE